jgi:hypothetical protein
MVCFSTSIDRVAEPEADKIRIAAYSAFIRNTAFAPRQQRRSMRFGFPVSKLPTEADQHRKPRISSLSIRSRLRMQFSPIRSSSPPPDLPPPPKTAAERTPASGDPVADCNTDSDGD